MRKKTVFCLLAALAMCAALAASASADVRRFTEWSAPVLLGPEVNTGYLDSCPMVSKDGLTMFFTSTRPGGSGKKDWYVSRRADVGDTWGKAEWLGPTINSEGDDWCTCLSLDEHEMIFRSERPGTLGLTDFFISRRQDRRDPFGWGPLVHLGSSVNSPASDYSQVLFEDESGRQILYFGSARTGKRELYASVRSEDGSFAPAQMIPGLSPEGMVVRRDGLEMIFATNQAGSTPAPDGKSLSFDIWVTTRDSTREDWSAPERLGSLSSPYWDGGRMSLSPDGLTLYFASDRAGGFGDRDIYMATRRILK